MLGRRRRKINPDQAPRDQFGRKSFHGAFTGGFAAGNQNTVADEKGFVSQPYFSSRENKAQPIPVQKMEDYMDAEDFDTMGRSQISIAERKDYNGPLGKFSNLSEQEVEILMHCGFGAADLYESNHLIMFSHMYQPVNPQTHVDDWIIVESPNWPQRPMPTTPSTFNPNEVIKLQPLKSITGEPVDELQDFSIDKMFVREGESEFAKENYQTREKRIYEPWEPDKLLYQRFRVQVIRGPEDHHHKKHRHRKSS